MKITTKLTDAYDGGGIPEEGWREYEVLVDGKRTGYIVKRIGTDYPEMWEPGSQAPYYLGSPDLRGGLPEARRIVKERLARS